MLEVDENRFVFKLLNYFTDKRWAHNHISQVKRLSSDTIKTWGRNYYTIKKRLIKHLSALCQQEHNTT